MKLTVSFESFEEWATRTRERAQKLARGEKIPPSRRINFEPPLPPEPEVLRLIGEEARRNGTSRLSSRDIDRIIKETRAQRKIDAAAKAERAKRSKKAVQR